MDEKSVEQWQTEAYLAETAAAHVKRNAAHTLTRGHIYKIRSRNLPYGVYNGKGGFIGIREKFGSLYLFTEYDWDLGPPYGTVTVLEEIGNIPDDIEPVESWWERDNNGKAVNYRTNQGLYDFLAATERRYGKITGYGIRPGDQEGKREDNG